jgi:putative membrane protein
MDPVLKGFLVGVPVVAGHFAITIGLLAIGSAIYAWLTPHRELELIREGNTAAATSFAGAIVGLAIPLAASMASSFVVLEVVVWGTLALFGQLAVYLVVDRLFLGLPQRIRAGDHAAAILLVGIKLGVALIGAASLTG